MVMKDVLKYEDFVKLNKIYFTEHNKLVKKYNINFIFLEGVKIPLIYLYEVIDDLFKNNEIFLKNSDIILLTITAISLVSKENKSDVKVLVDELEKKKILRYLKYVRYTIKSLKNIFNIILKDEINIQNFEQAIKNSNSIRMFYLILKYIKGHRIKIKNFYSWFIVGNRVKEANEMLHSLIDEF